MLERVMVDRLARRRLAELLRHVVAGQISKDDFLLTAEESVGNSEDDGVAAICAAVDALYADVSAVWPVRFHGPFRLTAETRRRMAIASLFLYSEAEYEWPVVPGPRGAFLDCLLAYSCGSFVFAGLMALALAAACAISGGGISLFSWLALTSAGCWLLTLALYRVARGLAGRFRAQWEQTQGSYGDYEVWPFLRQADFDEARRHPPLLCGHR